MIEVQNKKVTDWVAECAAMTKPEEIVWIDGSEAQLEAIRALAVETGEMIKLNEEKLPGCYYYRTDPKDVARDEKRTVICTTEEKDAGPTNNWVQKDEMYAKMRKLFDGSMKGRTMYVIPYSMGVVGSKFSKIGIEITDSIYVVLSMNIMTRIGDPVIEELNKGADFVKCLHSKAQVNAENKYIAQFPEENTIWSINSAYGGNVLLGKKCFALRIGSVLGKREGWMAEHMLILCVEAPNGEKKYISAAFPSACGKTNLAMLIPPKHLQEKGYKVYTIGDDIAWLRVGDDGRLYAVNPENGFFGVAPGTNSKTNNNALMTTKKNTIYTNVARNLDDNTVWWEGLDQPAPANGLDWQARPWNGQEEQAKKDTTTTLKSTDGKVIYVKDDNGSFREAKYADYYTKKEFYLKTSKTTGQYRYTGWQTIDGRTYFFDKNGNKVTGEQVIQGAKYNFNSDGSLNSGSGHMGIDVSKWNGNIDWNAVKNSGVSYVIIRCGYRGSTTGALIEDPKFRSNIQGAQKAGLKVGVYFFTQAVNEVEAVEEASMVISLVKGYNISYPVFLDVEASNGRGDRIDAATRTAVCRAFCQTIQNSGYKAGIYANKTWLNSYLDAPGLSSYKIWLAQYAASPSYTRTRYDMWQYSSKGSVAGISGNVDMNISYLGY